jgi:hypothetical protein
MIKYIFQPLMRLRHVSGLSLRPGVLWVALNLALTLLCYHEITFRF